MVEFVPLLIRVAALLSTASGITIFVFAAQAEAEARHFWWAGVAPALSGALAFWQPNRAVVISALVRATCSAYYSLYSSVSCHEQSGNPVVVM